uniref:Ankyrin repeat protein n=1 Tax=Panagrellus redivivus TaxID=6233 RepID=A0A7E5A1D3_PANRE
MDSHVLGILIALFGNMNFEEPYIPISYLDRSEFQHANHDALEFLGNLSVEDMSSVIDAARNLGYQLLLDCCIVFVIKAINNLTAERHRQEISR